MKWSKAVEIIEKELAQRNTVVIDYHRKWMKQQCGIDTVEKVVEYEYEGKTCKAVNTWHDQLNESSHIIDKINVL